MHPKTRSWLTRATLDDPEDPLSLVFEDDGWAIATDKIRIHAAPTWTSSRPAAYCSPQQVLLKDRLGNTANTPKVKIVVDAELLLDTLSTMTDSSVSGERGKIILAVPIILDTDPPDSVYPLEIYSTITGSYAAIAPLMPPNNSTHPSDQPERYSKIERPWGIKDKKFPSLSYILGRIKRIWQEATHGDGDIVYISDTAGSILAHFYEWEELNHGQHDS